MQTEILTASDVAKLAGVTPAAVRVWADSGRLKAVRTVGGVRLFTREDVDRVIAERVKLRRRRAA